MKRDSRERGERRGRGLNSGEGVNVGGLMAGGGEEEVASNFSLLSSEMTLQI